MDDVKFKQLVRSLKMPSKTEVSPYGNTSRCAWWEAKGGFAGEKTVQRVVTAALLLGFLQKDAAVGGNAEGTTSRYARTFTKDDQRLVVSTFYGQTPRDNRYSITLYASKN